MHVGDFVLRASQQRKVSLPLLRYSSRYLSDALPLSHQIPTGRSLEHLIRIKNSITRASVILVMKELKVRTLNH